MALTDRLHWPLAGKEQLPPDWQAHTGAVRGVSTTISAWALAMMANLAPGQGYSIAFAGRQPSPASLLPPLIAAGKGRVLSHPDRADALFFLAAADPAGPLPPRTINRHCPMVRKSRLHAAWAAVSGNDIRVDPKSWRQQAVESPDVNGSQPPRIVYCPVRAKPGMVYTRLLANTDNGAFMQDWHVPVIGGAAKLAMIATRPENRRFTHQHSQVRLVDPKRLFTSEERSQIKALCDQLGLDVGSLDVLRDRMNGKLFVVDADAGKLGPVAALGPWAQWTALKVLSRALHDFVVLGRPA